MTDKKRMLSGSPIGLYQSLVRILFWNHLNMLFQMLKIIIKFTCKECCMGFIKHTVHPFHPCYFWAFWFQENHISDTKKCWKQIKFDPRITQSLKDTVSQYGLCAFLCGLSVLMLLRCLYSFSSCFIIKKEISPFTIWDL